MSLFLVEPGLHLAPRRVLTHSPVASQALSFGGVQAFRAEPPLDPSPEATPAHPALSLPSCQARPGLQLLPRPSYGPATGLFILGASTGFL